MTTTTTKTTVTTTRTTTTTTTTTTAIITIASYWGSSVSRSEMEYDSYVYHPFRASSGLANSSVVKSFRWYPKGKLDTKQARTSFAKKLKVVQAI